MLAEPARVEALRFRGYEEVLSNHLDIHRVDQIETWLESWDLAGLVNARFQAPESWRDSNARVFEYASKVYQSHGRDREAGISSLNGRGGLAVSLSLAVLVVEIFVEGLKARC